MSSIKLRVSRLADEVKAAGISGLSMQTALEKVAAREDLSAEEVGRVAETANRDVQLHLHKVASNKRFKFEVADAKVAIAKLRSKTASAELSEIEKLASAIDEADGDPFAAPYRATEKLSVYQHEISDEIASKLASGTDDVEDRTTLFELDRTRLELEAINTHNQIEISKVASGAVQHENDAVQATMDLVEGGLTLPDLYAAIIATCTEADTMPEEAQKKADDLFELVISGLRARGVPVAKMGFRDYYDPQALEAIGSPEILEWTKAQCGYLPCQMDSLALKDTKTAGATYTEARPTQPSEGFISSHLHDHKGAPTDLLNMRDSVAKNTPKGHVLESAQNQTLPVRTVNGNHSLIVAVRGLVGDQRRMVRLHGASEYLGLKLREIADATNQLAGVREARV